MRQKLYPKEDGPMKTVCVRLPQSLIEKIEKSAKANRRLFSDIVRLILEDNV